MGKLYVITRSQILLFDFILQLHSILCNYGGLMEENQEIKIDEKPSRKSKSSGGFLNNLSIGKKLTMNTAVILCLTFFMGAIALFSYFSIYSSIKTMSYQANELLDHSQQMTKDFYGVRTSIYRAIVFGQGRNIEERDKELEKIKGLLASFEENSAEFIEHGTEFYPTPGTPTNDIIKSLEAALPPYLALFDEIVLAVENGSYTEAIKTIVDNASTVTTMIEVIENTSSSSVDILLLGTSSIQKSVLQSLVILIVSLVAVLVLGFIMAKTITNNIRNSINRLVENVENLRKGNFEAIETSNSKDEIGQVTRSFVEVVEIIEDIVEDVKSCDAAYENGTLQPSINASEYEGGYYDLAFAVNHIFLTNAQKIGYVMSVLDQFAKGSFNFKREDFPGEQKILTDTMFTCVDNIMKLNTKIITMTENANNGNLEPINTAGFENSWLEILEELNTLLVTIEVPIEEVNAVLNKMAVGNLTATINGDYKGVFNDMKTNVNTSVMAVNSAIRETNDSLAKIADNDLNFKITTEYKGDFNKIKFAINSIVDRLNNVFDEFLFSANSVTDIAGQLTSSSVNIANGATDQATSITELNVAVEGISNNTKENAKKSANAREIANDSMKNAVRGDSEMKTMLKSMEEIKAASDNIANIISVIDNIAFQTNLLALNAAVEAASAGQHGKGFAVVAEEVRDLARRSKEAASQTADLINESLRKVNLGNELANSTADALNEIVTSVSQVSGLLEEISKSSNEQAVAISEIVTNLGTFENVVQSNTSEAEESAASAKTLSEQANTLKSLIEEFELLDK